MKKTFIRLLLIGLGITIGCLSGDDTRLSRANSFEALLVTSAAFIFPMLGRGFEWLAAGSARRFAQVADREAKLSLRRAWFPLIGFGLICIGIGMGAFVLFLKGTFTDAWPALTFTGAGVGFISAEWLAARLFKWRRE